MKQVILILTICIAATFTSRAQQQADSARSDHFIVKMDLLSILTMFFESNDAGKYISYGFSAEYRINQKFGIQINGQYLKTEERYYASKDLWVFPEGRYYLKHHFVGCYMKFRQSDTINPVPGMVYYSFDRGLSLGVLYGYQRAFGRFQAEGRIGIGIAQEYYRYGPTGNGSIKLTDTPPYLDGILSINVGYRIF